MTSRAYQVKAIADLRSALASGKKAPVLVAPTGSGKTRIAAEICKSAKAKGNRFMFIAPRRKLVMQTAKAFREQGMDVGLVMAGHKTRFSTDVLVASMQTITTRGQFPEVDGILIDECHAGTGGVVKLVADHYRGLGKPVIGLTATPARGDGMGLGEVFDAMVTASSVAELTQMGYLVPVRYFAPSEPDLKGVKVTAGDYNQKQLGERMAPLIGDVVANWKRIAPGHKTVVFTVTIANAVALCDEFKKEGISAEWIAGTTNEDEQREIFKRHESGETLVLCNAQLLSFGWDSPSVTCCVLAKPTKSIANYLQMAGRILRPFPGKDNAILIDHSGIVDKLGFVDDDFGWTLDGKELAAENRSMNERKESKPIVCLVCKAVYPPAPKCPCCGAEAIRKAKAPEVIAAELEEIKRKEDKEKKKLKKEMTQPEKDRFYGELVGYARSKGFKDGWAYHTYKFRLGVYPARHAEARAISPDTAAWIKHFWIKKRKGQEAEQRKAMNDQHETV